MTTPPKPKKVVAPELTESSHYFTVGKEYTVSLAYGYMSQFGYTLHIPDDNGIERYCLQKNDDHLNGKNWIVTEYETP